MNKPHHELHNTADENMQLIIHLRDISHTMRNLYEGKGSQKQILIVLHEMEPITQRKLTQRLGIQPGSVSEVLSKLESAGLILRTPSERDHRTMDISLTPQGKTVAQEAAQQRKKRHDEMFSCLTTAEKTHLLELLEKVNQDWAKRYQNVEDSAHHGHRHL